MHNNNENIGITVFKKDELTFESLKHYPIGSILSIEFEDNSLGELTVIFHDDLDYFDDCGITVLIQKEGKRWLEYIKNSNNNPFNMEIRKYQPLENKNYAIRCFASGIIDKNYEIQLKDITWDELKTDDIGHIYTTPCFGKENVAEEKYGVLKYRDNDGVVMLFTYIREIAFGQYFTDCWIELIDFPK